MKFGLVYPQTEFSMDPAAVKDYAQLAEESGFNHILTYEHVLGANPARENGFRGPYTFEHPFLSPFLKFSFMAAVTNRIEFVTGILILPQRQTALAAKQAATLDRLSGGRLRLGIGIGWNDVEYAALGENFYNRGKRVEEQIQLLRLLWTQPLVDFQGEWHNILDAGINPLPVQQPIPIWIGGYAQPALERMARLSDGWLPMVKNPEDFQRQMEMVDSYLTKAGRTRDDIGIEVRISYGSGDLQRLEESVRTWDSAGVTHLSLNTMNCGFDSPSEHLEAVQRFSSLIDQI